MDLNAMTEKAMSFAIEYGIKVVGAIVIWFIGT